MGRPKLDTSDLIDSNVDLVFMYLIEGIKFEKLDVWTCNKFPLVLTN